MADSPKEIEEKLKRILNAWKTLARDKSFGGMTVEQFEAHVTPSFTTRETVATHDSQRTDFLTARDNADEFSLSKSALIVAGVVGDPTFGPDSSLYEAMGYTRKSERKSGLHRKGSPQSPSSEQ